MGILNTFWTIVLLVLTLADCTPATVYISNGTNILKIRKGHKKESIFSQPEGRIVGLASDIHDGLLFWSDVSESKRGIYRSYLNGSDVRLILNDVEECNGLAVNWVTNHLYWTDAKTSRIEMSNYDGRGRRILFGSDLDQPRGIIVEPMSGYVFWADQGTKQIERSQLSGNHRRILIDSDLHWPNQLAISPATRRLYWVDGMNHMIMSCDMNGKNIKLERNTTEKTGSNVIFGLALSGNRAIISVWFQASLYSTLVEAAAASWKVESEIIGTNELFSIIVVDGSVQETVFQHPCSQPGNGGCSHLCMPKGGIKYICVCPSFGGLALSKDKKTCQVPDNLLFYTLTGTGQVGFHAVGWPVTPYLTLVGWSSNPSAITYDPIEKTVYWSDVTEHAIYTSNLDGSNRNIFLNASHGIAIVDGLAIDWLQRRLYFTNLGLDFHGVDGSTCSSHTIEMISLDGRIRQTIITDLQKPRGVTIDNQNGYLYYTDWGTEPKIARAFLDGSEIEILKSEDLSSPNGLTIDNGQLYVTDSNYQNKTSGPQIWLFNMATNEWKRFPVSSDLKLPRGITQQDDTLYYTDWSTEEDTEGFIFQYNLKKSTLNKNPIITGIKPTGLHYSHRQISSEPDATCDNAACSDECIRTPADYSSERFHCSCPDTYNLILSSDKANCKEPENFLIVADLNTLKLKALDDHLDSKVHILHYGHAGSSYVALVYNDLDKTLFWSDLHEGRQAIMYSLLEKTEPKILVQVNHSIDCLALDKKHQKLYWTGYNNITGFIAEINLKHTNKPYKQLLVNLDSPRAVTIHSDKNIIFWSEYGLKSGKAGVYRCHTNCHRHKTVMAEKLQWPNSLVIYRNELYVADGFHGRIYVMDFKGGKRRELLYLSKSMDHIFGLQIYEHLLFYSRWYEPSVHMVDMITGKDEIFIDHLTQPTAIVVHHPSNINESSFCNTDKNDCKGMCVPVPHNYHCTCDPGYQLTEEKCIKLDNPWEQSDEAMCPEGCPEHSFCARLIPTLHYECVCAAGFQGNGEVCKECPNNTYKSDIGNSTCLPCPNDSDSQHILASKACLCKSPSARLVDGTCEETETTSTSRPTTTVTTTTITSTTTTTTTTTLPTTSTTTTMSTTTEPIITTRKKAANIGLPRFENCPNGDTITVALPTQENSVYVAVTWTATDHLDKQLALKSNIPYNEDGLHFKWLGKSERQKVIFTALDRWNQKAACEFYVIVEDKEAPHFTYCPHNIVIKTNLLSERVVWPSPIAEDNTQLEKVISSHQTGSDFTSGTTVVNYTAIDKTGNNATCNFSVTIIPETNCNLPKITNGRFVCGTDPPQLAMCYITCENKFGVNPLGVFTEPFNCKVLDNIHKLEEIMKTQQACLNNHHPFKVQQEFEIQFQGRCEQDDSSLHSKLSSAVTQYLEAQNHCWDVKCNFNNITVLCGPRTDGHRYKRSNYFTVTWNITINNVQRLPKTEIRSILEAFEQELAYVAELFSINVHDREYKSVPGSVKASAPYWQCKSGEMLQDEYCIPCPPGSMLNVTSQRCTFCMNGFYQDKEGQTSCKLCPDGVSAAEGATSLEYCISIPAIDEMSKFLIITTCTFGFVFLCLVIFMYLQYQRQQRKASNLKAAPTPRNTTTSVYVAPPPFPRVKPVNGSFETRDYMYVHEYEDIENASQVSKMPNPNIDALYRIPPHMQRRLASTENIYDD